MAEIVETTACWPSIRGVIADLDGVVYRGDNPIPDAVEAFDRWARAGLSYGFVTNNSTRSAEDVALKLGRMGVRVEPKQIVTSASAAAELMGSRWPQGTPVYVIGAPSLTTAIETAGFEITDREPQVVVMGLDREITHEKLKIAVRAIMNGARLIGTNPDLLLPTDDGFEPGAGAMLTAVAAAARTTPLVVGKPEPHMIITAMGRLGTAPADTVMIGDQVATDIQAGKRAGICSVLVTTGVPSGDADALEPPDFTVDSLLEIPFAS